MLKMLLSACVCLCLAAGTLRAGSEEDLVATARKTLQTYEKAVIFVDLVLKSEAKGLGGQLPPQLLQQLGRQMQKGTAEATIVDPSGLAVTAWSALNPKQNGSLGGAIPIQLVGQMQTAKYHLADGTEIPVRVVLKDEDTDVAFLAPLKPLDAETKAKLATIPLSDAAAAPELLDSTILIKRGGPAHDYVPMLELGLISGILSKPKSCYESDNMLNGAVAFDKQGKVLGLFVAIQENLPGLLPAADVAKMLPQALEEAKKPAQEKADAEEK
jgi:hypothetical protein